MLMKKIAKIVVPLSFVCCFLLFGICFIIYGSLPVFKEKEILSGLSAIVTVNRDENGVVLIQAKDRVDASFALGYVHGQDRFFQMDLLRRISAGEISALFGKSTIDFDKRRRFHDLKKVAQDIFNNLSSYEKKILKAYSLGVNQGITSLSFYPFEYILLRVKPQSWKEEDSILVILSMYFALQKSTEKKALVRWLTLNKCGSGIYKFLFKNGSTWDASLDDSISSILPIPNKSDFKYLLEKDKNYLIPLKKEVYAVGSNQWALDGRFTKDGKAMLANDMHLDLMVPNIWYHAALKYYDGDAEIRFVVGASLPGTPLVIVGSNGYVGWGLTNAELDTSDIILLDKNEEVLKKTETIKVKGDKDYVAIIDFSRWGPVLSKSYLNRRIALRWVAHDIDSCNLHYLDLENTKDVNSAISASRKIKGPVLNIMFADKYGNIAWTLIGSLLKRSVDATGELPIESSNLKKNMQGLVDPSLYPTIINPKIGFLVTANNRTLSNSWDSIVGNGTYINPVRAYQIKDRLRKINVVSEEDMLELQLCDEAIFLNRWHKFVLSLFDNKDSFVYKILLDWDGHASKNSRAYPIIREFRQEVIESVLIKLLKPVLKEYSDFSFSMFDFEESVWKIINSQSCNLLDSENSFCRFGLKSILQKVINKHAKLNYPAWGKINSIAIQHPLSNGLFFFNAMLDMSKNHSSGDFFVPKVMVKNVGASMRMVVRPGAEKEAIYQSPAGQSGNPLSNFYKSGHREWLKGEYFPLLPQI